ncbi:TIR domain-containing protein [Flammeovirgaceae bacterium SG7u.111]|nr:TIR domain-containing protein [Flammeovirgaceae bacterium SG7u.111]
MSHFKDAFISYGRAESISFAARIYKQLRMAGMDAWFDKVNIPHGDDYQQRIDNGIENAHNFIIILAPHSINSIYCKKEIDLAVSLGKRIIPIMHIEPSSKEVWDNIHVEASKRDYIFCREKIGDKEELEHWGKSQEWEKLQDATYLENWKHYEGFEGIDNFDRSATKLVELIEKDKQYVHQHTAILEKALIWQSKNKVTANLLVGKERMEAEKWLLTDFTPPAQPPCHPSDLHAEFIAESKKNANNLLTDVFISYASENRPIRERVSMALSHRAITSWTHSRDIKSSANFHEAIREGIEQADNLLFFITEESVVSDYCKRELEYAKELNKRVIPLLVEPVDSSKFPEEIVDIQYIDFTDNTVEADFQKDIDDILRELGNDQDYYNKHKVFLTQALKWERQHKNPSILLRGYNLDEALTWLALGKKRKTHRPLELHEEFITISDQKRGQLGTDVFVSYSRTDGDFARKINHALQFNGKTTWFDLESIASSSDFQTEINKGIETADNVLFILTPDAIASEYCAGEVAYAEELGKRFVTILYRDIDVEKLPPALGNVQWIDFSSGNTDFNTSFGELIRTIDTDREYVQEHTYWSQQALDWEKKGKPITMLLRGQEYEDAAAWMDVSKHDNKTPEVSVLQEEFIEQSRLELERTTQKEKKARQMMMAGVGIFLLVALVTVWISFRSAEQSEQVSLQKLVFDSQNYAQRNPQKAIRLAYEAYHFDSDQPKPPHLVKNICSIIQDYSGENLYVSLPHTQVKKIKYSPDGKYILTIGNDFDAYLDDYESKESSEDYYEGTQELLEEDAYDYGNYGEILSVKIWTSEGELINELNYKKDENLDIVDAYFGLGSHSEEEILIKTSNPSAPIIVWDFLKDKYNKKKVRRIEDLSFSPSRKYYISKEAGKNGYRIVNTKSDKEFGNLGDLDMYIFSPNEKFILYTLAGQSSVYLHTISNGKKLTLPLEAEPTYFAFSHATEEAPPYIITRSYESPTYVWNTSGNLMFEVPFNDMYYRGHDTETLQQRSFEIGEHNGVFFAEKAPFVLKGQDKNITRYNMDGTVDATIELSTDLYEQQFYSPNGDYTIVDLGDIWLYKFDKTSNKRQEGIQLLEDGHLKDVTFSPDGHKLIVSCVKTKSISFLQKLSKTLSEGDGVQNTAIEEENIVALFTKEGKLVEEFSLVSQARFSPNGKKIQGFTPYGSIMWATSSQIDTLVSHLKVQELTFNERSNYGLTTLKETVLNYNVSILLVLSLFIVFLYRIAKQYRAHYFEHHYLSIGIYSVFYIVFGLILISLMTSSSTTQMSFLLYYSLVFIMLSLRKIVTKAEPRPQVILKLVLAVIFLILSVYRSIKITQQDPYAQEDIITGFIIVTVLLSIAWLFVFIPIRFALRNYYVKNFKAFYIQLALPIILPLMTLTGLIILMPIYYVLKYWLRKMKKVKKIISILLLMFINASVFYTAVIATEGIAILVYLGLGLLITLVKRQVYPESVRQVTSELFKKATFKKANEQSVLAV